MAEESDEKREERAKSSTSQKELEKLAGDENWSVRAGVAANTNTPVSVLEKLAEDEDTLVRMSVAESICEHLGDKTWAKKIYKQIEDNAEDSFSSKKKNVGG
jgi:pentose-5-phosphate-3-epimerase